MKACPVSLELTDERCVRANSFLVLGTALAFVFTANPLWAVLLAGDFSLKVFAPRFSPFTLLARKALACFRVAPSPVDAGPKRFAAKLGLAMTLAVALAVLGGEPLIARALAAFLAAFATLEGAFGFCVGCLIYQAAFSRR